MEKIKKILKICIILELCFILFFQLGLLSAQELEIEILPHYYSKGYQVTYTPDIEISGIKFEIIGKNNNQTSRILSLSVLDSNINFPNETKELRIRQTKSLFMSDLIEVNQSNSTYFVKVFGINEKSDEIVHANDTITLNIENKEPENILNGIGESIFPSNPKVGLFAGGVIILCIGFVLWKYQMKDYLNRKSFEWKVKNAQKRRESYETEEGY